MKMTINEAINVINTWSGSMRITAKGNDFMSEFLDAVDVLKMDAIRRSGETPIRSNSTVCPRCNATIVGDVCMGCGFNPRWLR